MPQGKYQPVKSQAQRGMLFHLAEEGKISEDEARGKARAAKGQKLPVHIGDKERTVKAKGKAVGKGQQFGGAPGRAQMTMPGAEGAMDATFRAASTAPEAFPIAKTPGRERRNTLKQKPMAKAKAKR